jgi:hypothetical protein
MRRRFHLCAACLFAAAPLMNAHAAKPVDLHFLGGVSLGYSTFEFPAKLDHDLTFPMYQFNGAVAYKKLYVALNLADTLAEADVSEEEDVGRATRYDYDLSLGYQLTPRWGAFIGYKKGATEIDFLSRELDDEGDNEYRSESYGQQGMFAGVSFSHKFPRAGKLTFNLAYADLDATNKFVADVEGDDEDVEELEFDDLTGTVRGKSTGFSYGVRWSIPVAGRLLYYASYKINDYQQDLKVDDVEFNDIDETISNFSMGIVYVY